MKYAYLKKLLIKTVIVCILLVTAAAGALYGVSAYEDSVTQDRDTAQAQANTIISEASTLKDRIAKSSESYSIYEKILRYNKLADFSLNRDAATKLFDQLKKDYPISNLQVSILPVKDLTSDVGKKKTGKVVYSDVKIQFDATTDTTAFRFMNALSTQFPGFVSYQEVKLSRKIELSGTVFQDLASGHLPMLVSGELSFNWLGIRPNESPETGK